jgi:hypothetical protein
MPACRRLDTALCFVAALALAAVTGGTAATPVAAQEAVLPGDLPIAAPDMAFNEFWNRGETPAGTWQASPWRADLRTGRVDVDLELSMLPTDIGLRPGPTVVFWQYVGAQVVPDHGDIFDLTAGPIRHATLEFCPNPADPCEQSVRLDGSIELVLAAIREPGGVQSVGLRFTVVRTFEAGSMVQVLPPLVDTVDHGTLGAPLPAAGRLASGVLPVDILRGGDGLDYPTTVQDAVTAAEMATGPGPDPWLPVELSIRFDAPCDVDRPLSLVNATGDRSYLVELGRRVSLDALARVTRNVSWSVAFETQIDPIRVADLPGDAPGYRVQGIAHCGVEARANLQITALEPGESAATVPPAAGLFGSPSPLPQPGGQATDSSSPPGGLPWQVLAAIAFAIVLVALAIEAVRGVRRRQAQRHRLR